jgi:hypothetical protein
MTVLPSPDGKYPPVLPCASDDADMAAGARKILSTFSVLCVGAFAGCPGSADESVGELSCHIDRAGLVAVVEDAEDDLVSACLEEFADARGDRVGVAPR